MAEKRGPVGCSAAGFRYDVERGTYGIEELVLRIGHLEPFCGELARNGGLAQHDRDGCDEYERARCDGGEGDLREVEQQ